MAVIQVRTLPPTRLPSQYSEYLEVTGYAAPVAEACLRIEGSIKKFVRHPLYSSKQLKIVGGHACDRSN